MTDRRSMPAAAIISIAIGLSACSAEPQRVYVHPDLSQFLPPRPALPHVGGEDLQCLRQDVYQRLYDRQRLIREYAEQCEAIVKATKKSEGIDGDRSGQNR